MNWFFIALLSTLCFSVITHIDKYLISRYVKESGIGALMLFSAFFAIFVLPFVFLIEKNIFSISLGDMFFLILIGILSFLAVLFYFKALTYADASTIIPFFQLIPVFGFILGFFLLKENIPLQSIVAGLVIMIGVLILGFSKQNKEPIVFQGVMVLLMITSSFTYALYETLFKLFTLEGTFWVSLFWQNIGLLIAGVFMYLAIPKYRGDFHRLIKENGKAVLGLNIVNETLNTVAVGLVQYASLLAPIALVLLVNSMQPVFVFLMGVLLTILLPQISKEDIARGVLLQKSLAIMIVILGTYLLYF